MLFSVSVNEMCIHSFYHTSEGGMDGCEMGGVVVMVHFILLCSSAV